MEELRRMREEAGFTQVGLAKASGVARATINKIEQGYRSPTIETLERLADALGQEIADFFPIAQPRLLDSPAAGAGANQDRQQRLHYLRYWRVFIIGLARRFEEKPPETLGDIMPLFGALASVLEQGMLDPPSWHVGLSEDFDRAQVWRGIRRIVEVANSVEQGEEGGATVRYLQEKLGA